MSRSHRATMLTSSSSWLPSWSSSSSYFATTTMHYQHSRRRRRVFLSPFFHRSLAEFFTLPRRVSSLVLAHETINRAPPILFSHSVKHSPTNLVSTTDPSRVASRHLPRTLPRARFCRVRFSARVSAIKESYGRETERGMTRMPPRCAARRIFRRIRYIREIQGRDGRHERRTLESRYRV